MSKVHGGTAALAALTTVFTAPCPTSFILTSSKLASQYPPFPTDGPASCDPPNWDSNIADKAFQYYSPAICPKGFTVGCFVDDARTSEGFPAIEASETAAYCVPSGFACTSDTTDFRGGIWGFVPTTSGRATFTAAPALQIRWADSDLSLLETHPLTPGLLLAGATQPISVVAASTTRDNIPTPFTTPSTTTSKTSVAGFATNPTLSSTLLTSTTPLTDIVNDPTSNQLPVSASAVSSSAANSSGAAPIPPVSKGTGFLSNTGAKIAVTVLLSVLLAIVVVGTGFVLIRRRKNGKELGESFPSWLRSQPRTSQAKAGRSRQRARDAELGSSGKTQELGPGDVLGTATHPAELEGSGTAGAWRLRLSRILSMRSWSPGASPERHSVARTYATSGTSESTDSSDWESFVKGRNSNEPDGLGVPRMVHTRAATVRTTSSARTARLSRDTLGVPGRNVEGRLSGGTFGRGRLSTPSSRFSVPSPTPSMPSPWRAPSVQDEG